MKSCIIEDATSNMSQTITLQPLIGANFLTQTPGFMENFANLAEKA